jgi:hypothetical protein
MLLAGWWGGLRVIFQDSLRRTTAGADNEADAGAKRRHSKCPLQPPVINGPVREGGPGRRGGADKR